MFSNCESLLSIKAEFNPKNNEVILDVYFYYYKVITIHLSIFRNTNAGNIQGIFCENTKTKI